MNEQRALEGGSDVTVLHERTSSVNVIFGFLVVAFSIALVRGHLGATTDLGRLVGDSVLGVLVVGTSVTWWYVRRHPARFEISTAAIVYAHRGLPRSTRWERGPGHLSIRLSPGRHPRPHLCYSASEQRFPLDTFDRHEVVAACRAHGWEFDQPGRR